MCSVDYIDDIIDNKLMYHHDTESGQLGSPIIIGNYIVGMHIGGNQQHNTGVTFTSKTLAWIEQVRSDIDPRKPHYQALAQHIVINKSIPKEMIKQVETNIFSVNFVIHENYIITRNITPTIDILDKQTLKLVT